MPQFDVDIDRISYCRNTIRVTAETPEEAQGRAMDVAGNVTYKEYSADYEAMDVRLADPGSHSAEDGDRFVDSPSAEAGGGLDQ